MEKVQVDKLLSLRRLFDVFTETPLPPETALKKGLYPPFPVSRGALVWGGAYLEHIKSMGTKTVISVDVDLPPRECLLLALHMENRRDRYTWEEKSRIFAFMEKMDIPCEDHDIGGLIQSEGSFAGSAKKYTALPGHIKALVDNGDLDVKSAHIVSSLSPAVAAELHSCIGNLSFSSRRQLFIWVHEIIERDRLNESAALHLLRSIQAASEPLKEGKKIRFPELTGLEKKLSAFTEKNLRGTGIELRPPANFEGAYFEVRFRWHSDKQLDKIIQALRKVRDESNELYALLYPSH